MVPPSSFCVSKLHLYFQLCSYSEDFILPNGVNIIFSNQFETWITLHEVCGAICDSVVEFSLISVV